jgi:hypothetical protein
MDQMVVLVAAVPMLAPVLVEAAIPHLQAHLKEAMVVLEYQIRVMIIN